MNKIPNCKKCANQMKPAIDYSNTSKNQFYCDMARNCDGSILRCEKRWRCHNCDVDYCFKCQNGSSAKNCSQHYLTDANAASMKLHQNIMMHQRTTGSLSNQDILSMSTSFACTLLAFFDSPYGIEGNRAELLLHMNPNNEKHIMRDVLASLMLNGLHKSPACFVSFHEGVTKFFSLPLTPTSATLSKLTASRWMEEEIHAIDKSLINDKIVVSEISELLTRYFPNGEVGVVQFLPCYLECKFSLQKLLRERRSVKVNHWKPSGFPSEQKTSTNTMPMTSIMLPPAANNSTVVSSPFQFQFQQIPSMTNNSFQQQQQQQQKKAPSMMWNLPPTTTTAWMNNQTPVSPWQNSTNANSTNTNMITNSNNAPTNWNKNWNSNKSPVDFSKTFAAPNVGFPTATTKKVHWGAPIVTTTANHNNHNNKTQWNAPPTPFQRPRASPMFEQKQSTSTSAQITCVTCQNVAVGQKDIDQWFSKNQRNKAKNNCNKATCINCINHPQSDKMHRAGNRQAKNRQDRATTGVKQFSIRCSSCKSVATGAIQMERYFSKKQRSKAKQGKSCVCKTCTDKQNTQWNQQKNKPQARVRW